MYVFQKKQITISLRFLSKHVLNYYVIKQQIKANMLILYNVMQFNTFIYISYL